jgi:hypothetical protein
MPELEDSTQQVKANTDAIRENLAAIKELGVSQLKNNLDKNRQELRSFKSDAERAFQDVFKGINRDFERTLDFRQVLQKGLNDTSKQIQKTIQQSITQAIQQSMGSRNAAQGNTGIGGMLGNLIQAPISGLFRNSQGQLFADASKALAKGRRNL